MPDILDIQQGSDGSINVAGIVDKDGNPVDVTGWDVLAQARPSRASSTVWAEWSSTPSGTQSTATPGNQTVALEFTAAETSAWAGWAGQVAVIGAQLTSPGGQTVELITYARLKPEVVRAS